MGDASNSSQHAHMCFLEYFLEALAKQNFPQTLERLRDACAFVEHFLASPLLYDIRSLYSYKYGCSRDGELESLLKGACLIHIKRQDTVSLVFPLLLTSMTWEKKI